MAVLAIVITGISIHTPRAGSDRFVHAKDKLYK